ncbi:MAG: hypothetical protein IT371_29780 [Deltaproteobacteria bacterium]|nr:hypothetical protein [Deltaproteobacteria bacterium]
MPRRRSLASLAAALLALASLLALGSPLGHAAQPTANRPAVSAPGLRVTTVAGRKYYVTYRVCSAKRAAAYQDTSKASRWATSNQTWQFGDGFYLFTELASARKFVGCGLEQAAEFMLRAPSTEVSLRDTIVEILLPKDEVDRRGIRTVAPQLSWARRGSAEASALQDVRNATGLIFGGWQEDPDYPAASFAPLVGAPQLVVTDRSPGSVLNQALVRVRESSRPGRRAPSVGTARATAFTYDAVSGEVRGLAGPQASESRRAGHAELHALFAARQLDGTAVLGYLARHFPQATQALDRRSGTWEGYTVREHTEKAFGVLTEQLPHVDLTGLAARHPEINPRRVLALALALHDVGKPRTLEQARSLLTQIGRGLLSRTEAAKQLVPHEEHSLAAMTPVLWQLGCSPAEIKLARSLVENHTLGRLAKGSQSFTGAVRELEGAAAAAGLAAADYYKLQLLFYTADAGSYPVLRADLFDRAASGRLSPKAVHFQMIELRLGDGR